MDSTKTSSSPFDDLEEELKMVPVTIRRIISKRNTRIQLKNNPVTPVSMGNADGFTFVYEKYRTRVNMKPNIPPAARLQGWQSVAFHANKPTRKEGMHCSDIPNCTFPRSVRLSSHTRPIINAMITRTTATPRPIQVIVEGDALGSMG